MINVYKNRAIFFLFGIILIINTVLMSLVFFAFSSIVESDYTEKLTTVAEQTTANANRIFSFFEEEIELFINKYNVEEGLGSFNFDTPNFVRTDSTSFEKIMIFKGEELVYASGAEIVDFYRQTEFYKKIFAVTESKVSGWTINEEKESVLRPFESLVYVRTLFDTDTKEKIGCVVAQVSQVQLIRLLKLDSVVPDRDKKEFLPHSVGICVDGKIFFLSNTNAPKIIPDTDKLETEKDEKHFVNSIGGKKFITVHSIVNLKNKIHLVLFLFITLYIIITVFSYRLLGFIVSEICERIDSLNCKIENYGDKSL